MTAYSQSPFSISEIEVPPMLTKFPQSKVVPSDKENWTAVEKKKF